MASTLSKNTVATKNKVVQPKAATYTFNGKASKDDLHKGRLELAKRGGSLKKFAHELAVNHLLHYVMHGDDSGLLPMANAVGSAFGKGMRRAFIDWAVTYVNTLEWSQDNGGKFFTRKAKGLTREMNDDAKVKPFWDKFDRSRDAPQPWDFREQLAEFVKKMQTGFIRAHADELPEDIVKAHRGNAGKITAKEVAIVEAMARDAGVKVDSVLDDKSHEKHATNKDAPAKRLPATKAKATPAPAPIEAAPAATH